MSQFSPFGATTYTLNSSISSTQNTITLSSFTEPVTGTPYTMALLNTDIFYFTISPKTTSSEFGSATGITQNSDGTATLTGVTRGLAKKYPFTSDSAYKLPHSGQSIFIISDAPQVFNKYVTLENAETISGIKTFSVSPIVPTPTTPTQAANKAYADSLAIAGAPNASTSVQGLVQEATQAQADAKTATGSTGAKLFQNLSTQRSTLTNDYVADTGTANTYAIAPSPAITAYAVGQTFSFKATNANTTASTLNVNSLGTKNIFKRGSLALVANDIIAGQIVEVEYDGTQFQMLSQLGNAKISQIGTEIYAADSVGTDAYAITLVPAITAYTTGMVVNFKAGTTNIGAATLNINAVGAKAIVKNFNVPLSDGDIAAGQIISVVYDATADNFQMQSQGNNASGKIYEFSTPVTVASSTAETTLMSVSIPANTLGTTGCLDSIIDCSAMRCDTGTLTFRLKYGATTLATATVTAPGAGMATAPLGEIRARLYAVAATNSQKGFISINASRNTAIDSAGANVAMIINRANGTSAEDSTAAKTFTISVQPSASAAANTVVADAGYIQVI